MTEILYYLLKVNNNLRSLTECHLLRAKNLVYVCFLEILILTL